MTFDQLPPGRTHWLPSALRRSCSAISLTELLVTIAVIAILAAVATPLLVGILPRAGEEVAREGLERLNRAVHSYEMAAREIQVAPGDGAAVVALLRTRSASIPGSPFLENRPALTTTSSNETYRAVWTGRVFTLLLPGQEGTGLDLQVR